MKPNSKSILPTLFATALAALIAMQIIVAPVMAATVYAWDFSGVHGFYNADTKALQPTRPVASEAGGFLWTDILQELNANHTLATGTYKICFILPTTGGLGTIGVDEIRGADIAVTQANLILNATATVPNHPTVNFTDANRQDSATNPTTAKTGFDTLLAQGCQVTIGAAGSGETSGFFADANTNQVPTISPSSTAASLALSGDYLFRTPGNDLVQSPATALWAFSQGLKFIAIIARNDPYGTGLANGIHDAFNTLGGTANAPIIYDPASTSSQQTATDTLNTQIGTLLGSHPASQVGVIVIAFADDGTTIFDKARTETNLPNVRWIGTDGIAGDRAFVPPPAGVSSTQIAAFLAHVNLTGSQPSAPSLGTSGAFSANLAYNGSTVPMIVGCPASCHESGTLNVHGSSTAGTGYFSIYGITPQPYWDYAYDAAVLAMLAILKGNSYTGTSIADWLGRSGTHSIANITIGATGLDSLAPTGDRAKQHYIIYGYTATTAVTTPALPNAFIILATLLFTATAAIAITRKRRI